MPTPVVARPKARMVLDILNTGDMGSNPARGVVVLLFLCCAVLFRYRPWDGQCPI